MLESGSVVKSISGRDKDRFYLVVEIRDGFALIADGKVRKLASPKKKSLKHLAMTNTVLALADVTSDKKLRKLLAPLQNELSVSTEGGNLHG